MTKGLDVSSYQHPGDQPIDFAKVKAAGYRFVYIKATEVSDTGVYANPWLQRDVRAARAAGLDAGAYLFLHPGHGVAEQVTAFLTAVKGLALNLPDAIDLEVTDGKSSTVIHDCLDAARVGLHKAHRRTITYSYGPFITEHIPAGCGQCAADRLWLAAYQAKQPDAPKPWKRLTVWQNYDKANVPGVPSVSEDADVYLGSDYAGFTGRPARLTRRERRWARKLTRKLDARDRGLEPKDRTLLTGLKKALTHALGVK